MSALQDFEDELGLLLEEWRALGINTARLTARIAKVGGVATAEEYVRLDTPGFEEAYRRLGAAKTIEGLILRFEDIFDNEVTGLARSKLDGLAAKFV
jgi:hypothetical protein